MTADSSDYFTTDWETLILIVIAQRGNTAIFMSLTHEQFASVP